MVIERGALIVDFTDPDRQVGDCCPRGYIHVRYRGLKGPSPERLPRTWRRDIGSLDRARLLIFLLSGGSSRRLRPLPGAHWV
jgi:hypothetical protein